MEGSIKIVYVAVSNKSDKLCRPRLEPTVRGLVKNN